MIDDVVAALIALAEAPRAIGHVVDVGTGEGHSVREVVETIADVLGTDVQPEWGAIADRAGEPDNLADVTAAKQLARWSSTIDLRSGLAQTVKWYTDELRRQRPSLGP
jgi:nucleoside-diphosphate-sugar epimerase